MFPGTGSATIRPPLLDDDQSWMTIEQYDILRTSGNFDYHRGMDDVVEPVAADFQLPRILAALADPHRLAAVRYVARNGESWCTQVMQEAGLPMTKSTFSHHLRILRESGVLTKRIQGTKGYVQLRKDDLDSRFPGLMDSVTGADADVS
jgi:DNA-binding transcriptional ArsR family regulator